MTINDQNMEKISELDFVKLRRFCTEVMEIQVLEHEREWID